MSFIEWLEDTYGIPLEDFWECPDKQQANIEAEYQEYLKETEEDA